MNMRCHKVLRIKAVLRYCSWTVLKPWQVVTLSDLIFAIYPWIHGLRDVNVQKITNIYKWNLIKLFQNSAKVAASTNSETTNFRRSKCWSLLLETWNKFSKGTFISYNHRINDILICNHIILLLQGSINYIMF